MLSHFVGYLLRRSAGLLETDLTLSGLASAFDTVILICVVLASIQYTVGQVITSLPMTECPKGDSLPHANVKAVATQQGPNADEIESKFTYPHQEHGLYAEWWGMPIWLLYQVSQAIVVVFIIVYALGFGLAGVSYASGLLPWYVALCFTQKYSFNPEFTGVTRYHPKDLVLWTVALAVAEGATLVLPIVVI
ncbi:hypothetical protein F5Y16DRAFT_404431 [Xylariaceae sp. FL0255]|nr:hypothetical protein F5Y16DRAFT_404431 [Xylariaceae sp. FL0255]